MSGIRCAAFALLVVLVALTAFVPGITMALENSVPEEPTITVRLTPAKPYLQEEIVQHIRVVARYPFEELVLDLPPVPGAEIVTLQRPTNRHFETYGSEGYIYETSRAIFPKQSGELEIPAVHVNGSIGVSRDEKRAFALGSDATTLTVRPPPASFGDTWWLVAREARVDEGWSRSFANLHVGDKFTRAVTVTVAGATGAHLPELVQEPSNGLTILPGTVERSTEITPAGVIGTIRRSFDFRVDSDQPIIIRPVRVAWWNTSTEIERTAATAAARIEPL
ncbi:MAG: protein BatD, partial [Rhizobiales bacterium]|nr:protein BatD [Hyphomicrobiales bacterium]